MNDLLADPTLRVFTICAAILTLKMILMTAVIGVFRNTRGVYVTPEDYRFSGRTPGAPDELVERLRRVHQNDVESIVPFLAIGLLFALAGGFPTAARWLFIVFTGARLLHTVFYLAALQPWRSVIFGVGATAVGIMSILLVWRVVE